MFINQCMHDLKMIKYIFSLKLVGLQYKNDVSLLVGTLYYVFTFMSNIQLLK